MLNLFEDLIKNRMNFRMELWIKSLKSSIYMLTLFETILEASITKMNIDRLNLDFSSEYLLGIF